MPKWVKLSLKILGIFLSVCFILWMVVAAVVYYNRESLLKTVSAELNDNIKGKITIESMEPSLIRGFPGISVELKNVLLRDSLWDIHKHDLIKAKSVFAAVDVWSIIQGTPEIKDIRLENGEIYLFTDSNGVRNTDIFRKKSDAEKSEGGGGSRIGRVFLNDMAVIVDDQLKNKYFKFNVNRFLGKINYTPTGWEGEIELKTAVESFAFNVGKGSFLKDKELTLDWNMNYVDAESRLYIPTQKISIGKDDLKIGGNIGFADSTTYELDIIAEDILFANAVSLLNPHIISRMKPYTIKSPIDVQANLKGRLKRGGDPVILAKWVVKDNTVSTMGEVITDCSFTGSYTNELVVGQPRRDPNSIIRIYALKGKFHKIPFTADSILVNDLRNPVFTGRFKSNFPMKQFNEILGGSTFAFNSGNASLDLSYKAPFNQNDKGLRYINGTIKVSNASATYIPRKLPLNGMNMVMNFKGQDLQIQNLRVKTGGSSLVMDGNLRNFANLYYTDPKKILIDWQVRSPQINLNEFLVFLARRSSAPKSTGKSKSMGSISSQLDVMLEQASMNMDVRVDKLLYQKFEATGVRANMTLQQSGIVIRNVSLNQGGGSIKVSGNIDQTGSQNKFNIKSTISNVNVQKLFYAFENFGQDAITDRNLRGTFNGGTNVSGAMTQTGSIVPRSFRGTVDFDIQNGALVNFEPMQKVGAFAFANRDFNNIKFTSLKNKLTLAGEKVIIPPMEIRSSVMNIFLDGIYSFGKGTNIAIKVPLRNPEKDNDAKGNKRDKDQALKGIVINLRALDGDDGNVRFRLGKRTPGDYVEE